tara:strand:+ start:342 stop:563 length:222 start_codon:yes stop_codon:yes gene_type:complete
MAITVGANDEILYMLRGPLPNKGATGDITAITPQQTSSLAARKMILHTNAGGWSQSDWLKKFSDLLVTIWREN